jgi:hypothetical protein
MVVWAASNADIDQMVTMTRLLKQRYDNQELALKALQNRIKELQSRVVELEQQALAASPSINGRSAPVASAPAATGNKPAQQAVAAATPSASPEPAGNKPAQQAIAAAAPIAREAGAVQAGAVQAGAVQTGAKPSAVQAQTITSTQGIPLFDKRFSFEQGITYTHYDKRSLVLRGFLALDSILLGQIDLQQIKTDQLQYDLTGRWTLSERVSVDLNMPLVYRRSLYFSPGAGGAAANISDLSNGSSAPGDASVGLYYQLPKKAPTDLDWISSIRIKAPSGDHAFGIKLREAAGNDNLVIPVRQPTGNGIWSVTLGMSVLKTYDPVVLFGNFAYVYNIKRSFSDLSSTQDVLTPGDVKMGNAWSLGAGFALALSDKTSASFSYAQLLQQAAHLRTTNGPWNRQVGSDANSATLNMGLTHQLSQKLSMVGTLSVGLTPDAPNFSIGFKFPYSF